MELVGTIQKSNVFFKLARSTPVFVIDDRVYYSKASGGKKRTIKEGPRLGVLERISDLKLREEYKEFRESAIKKESSGLRRLKKDYLAHSVSKDRLVQFTVEEIFPYLRKENDEILGDILGVEEKSESLASGKTINNQPDPMVEKYISGRLGELLEGSRAILPRHSVLEKILFNQKLIPSSRNETLFSDITGNHNFAMYNREVFFLALSNSSGELEIGGKKYSMIPSCSIDEFQKRYAHALEKKITSGVLENEIRAIRFSESKNDNNQIYKKREYHEKDFGFVNSERELTVYVDVPEHVLRDFDGRLYNFPGHRLGIKISYSSEYNKIQLLKSPYSLGRVSGPFYGWGSDLCMGDYSMEYMERMSKGQAFAKLLFDARNVVLHGYRPGRVTPRINLGDFTHRRISPAEVKRRNLPITNINYQTRNATRRT
jgi:hypothetical protein